MTAARFVIAGEPVGKGRPRFSSQGANIRTFTPPKTASYENLVKLSYTQQSGLHFGSQPVAITVVAYFGIPQSASRKKQEAMRRFEIVPTKKPDSDNILKCICDALNGIAYNDDSQIVHALVIKRYADSPHVEVIISQIDIAETPQQGA